MMCQHPAALRLPTGPAARVRAMRRAGALLGRLRGLPGRPAAMAALQPAVALACILILPTTALSVGVVETGAPDKVTTSPPLSATAQDSQAPQVLVMPRPGVTLWDEIGHAPLRSPTPSEAPQAQPPAQR